MPYYKRNIIVLCITIFLAAVSWNQVVPFLPLFLKEMGVKRNLLDWAGFVFAMQAVASIIAMPFWGKMGDKFGQKPMTLRAGVFLVLIYFGTSLCREPWQLAVLRFLNGALTGFIPGSFALIATNTPDERAPQYLANAQTAAAAGMIIGPALGGFLANVVGYRGAMQVSSAAVLVSVVLVWRLVREPNKAPAKEKTSLVEDFALSLKSPVLASLMIAAFAQAFFGSAIYPMLALHLEEMRGFSAKWLTGAIFALPAVGFVLFAKSWTRLGGNYGYDKTIISGLALTGISSLALMGIDNTIAFAAAFFIASVFLSAVNPSTGALTCIRIRENFRGRAYGMQNSAGMLAALLGPLAASRMAKAFGIPWVFFLSGFVCFAGALIFLALTKRWDESGDDGVSTQP